MDPACFFLADEVENLVNAMEPEINLIHITRSYFDILMSFERGAINIITQDGLHELNTNSSCILNVLKKKDQSMKELEENGCSKNSSYEKLFTRLVSLFMNDMICIELCRNALRHIVIDYDEINTDLLKIAKFIGVDTDTNECNAILSKPLVRKLKKLNPDKSLTTSRIKEAADFLDRERKNALNNQLRYSNYISMSKEGNPNIVIPGLSRFY